MNKKLQVLLLVFIANVAIYLLLYTLVIDFRIFVNQSQVIMGEWAEDNKPWMYLITFAACLLGSASIVFPIPFPTIMFIFGRLVMQQYGGITALDEVLANTSFWLEIAGLTFVGGIGCAFGEFSGYAIGRGAKAVAEKRESRALEKLEALAKKITENPRRAPLLIFLFALSPLPDDLLIIPLGMAKYPWYKCIIPSWLGKNFTTFFYMIWPVLIAVGVRIASDPTAGDVASISSGIYTEAIMFTISIVLVVAIMSLDWQHIFERWEKKRAGKSSS